MSAHSRCIDPLRLYIAGQLVHRLGINANRLGPAGMVGFRILQHNGVGSRVRLRIDNRISSRGLVQQVGVKGPIVGHAVCHLLKACIFHQISCGLTACSRP
ncbi:hypothetical protein D3C78_1479630 [compost metagenome]